MFMFHPHVHVHYCVMSTISSCFCVIFCFLFLRKIFCFLVVDGHLYMWEKKNDFDFDSIIRLVGLCVFIFELRVIEADLIPLNSTEADQKTKNIFPLV